MGRFVRNFEVTITLDEFFMVDNFRIIIYGTSFTCHRYLLYTKMTARVYRLQKAFCIKGSIAYGGEQVYGRNFEVKFVAKFCHLCPINTAKSAPER